MWKNPLKLPANIRKEINRDLANLCSGKYYEEIPLSEVFEILNNGNVVALQEDGEEWEGILCGDSSCITLQIGAVWSDNDDGIYTPCDNSVLVLSWYRMQSGRFEINAYLS